MEDSELRTFPPERLAKLAEIEAGHFWFAARRRLVLSCVARWIPVGPGVVADLGCGTGSLVAELRQRRYRAVGFDLHRVGAGPIGGHPPYVQADLLNLPIRRSALSGALLLDVLEHVDDRAALAEVRQALRPGGVIIVIVPAHPWLWSVRDDDAGHLCRYSRRRLRDVVEAAGFRVLDLASFQCLLLPLFAVSRWIGRRDRRWRDAEDSPRPWLNAVLAGINAFELIVGRIVKWPVGSSLVVVAERTL